MGTVADYLAIGITVALVVYSIILHEIAHAYSAYLLGDPTAAQRGRLTLNPVKHIDPFQTILLPLMLFVLSQGRFIFGGAKPVPINPFAFRNRAKGMMITGASGPAVNLAIMLVCALVVRVLFPIQVIQDRIVLIFARVGFFNMILLTFNLVPIPPLDGSRVLSYFLPRDMRRSYQSIEPYGLFIVMGVLVVGLLDPILTVAVKVYWYLSGVNVFSP